MEPTESYRWERARKFTVVPRELKIVVVGCTGVGKTSVTMRRLQNVFVTTQYDPNIEDSYRVKQDLGHTSIIMEILDTAETLSFQALRDLYIKNGDGFAVLFSLISEQSYNSVRYYVEHIKRIKDADTGYGMVLVGNKCDLEDRIKDPDECIALANDLGMHFYIETSAKLNINIEEMFLSIIAAFMDNNKGWEDNPKYTVNKKSTCALL